MRRLFSFIILLLILPLLSCGNHRLILQKNDIATSTLDKESIARSIFDFTAAGQFEEANKNLKKLAVTDEKYATQIKALIEFIEGELQKKVILSPGEKWPPENHALLVFGCRTNPDGSPAPLLLARLEKTLGLARRAPDSLIIVTGGGVKSVPEGPAMAKWLIQQGIAPERIVVDDQARSTLENATCALPLIAQRKISSITLITTSWHIPRSFIITKKTFEREKFNPRSLQAIGSRDGLTSQEYAKEMEKERIAAFRDGPIAAGFWKQKQVVLQKAA